MLDREGRLEVEIDDLRKQRDAYAGESHTAQARLSQIAAILAQPINDEEEDVAAFGRGAWVYCSQHCKPHQTGWCSVSPRDKVGLGVDNAEAAYQKCRDWGLELYGDRKQA
jgi:hypothetical protein